MKTTIYELYPIHSARKSFYEKAHVIDYGDGTYDLQSYSTIVSHCENGIVTHLGRWSQTTSRHQKEFEKQFAA